MKIYINSPKENWVVDRFVSEWKTKNKTFNANSIKDSDIIWIIAPWTWRKLSKRYLKQKKVIATIHHIDEEKFNDKEKKDFLKRDQFVDVYHTVSDKSKIQLEKHTNKPIFTLPFWINQNVWFEINEKELLRNKFDLDINSFLIGSFQRDTEGKDLISPKLSKGPDQFFYIVKKMYSENKSVEVVLAGNRRNYLIEKLKKEKIPFKYFEMADFKTLNELYNCLDLYIVSSRVEGGPQAILECAITKTPVISTDVGIASQILNSKSIYDPESFSTASPDIEYAYRKSMSYMLPKGIENFLDFFQEVYEN